MLELGNKFIKGFKNVECSAVRIIKDGRIFSIQENFNSYITCLKLSEGIDGKYLEDLKLVVKNINQKSLPSSLKNVYHTLQDIVLAIGNRCVGIDHMLDYVYEFIIKACNNIEFTFDFEKLKNKAYRKLDKHVFNQAGRQLGLIFGQLKKFSSSFNSQ